MKSLFKFLQKKTSNSKIKAKDNELIDPEELINELSIEEFNYYSDEYYKTLPTPEMQMGKPFSTPKEVAHHLQHLGLLFQCLNISPSMKVLDFGAGTCWLSKFLWQMGCDVIASDVSKTALTYGKELFKKYPSPTPRKGEIAFKVFDGHKLNLPDNSVDRIICYDVLHHVPNLDQVLAEFFRILKPSGVVALSEPISESHSKTLHSQHEMRNFSVLENNLDPLQLNQMIQKSGFSPPRFKLYTSYDKDFSFEEYMSARIENVLPDAYQDACLETSKNEGIFYFTKPGVEVKDSRKPDGLAHRISTHTDLIEGKVNKPLRLTLTVENTGNSLWIHSNKADFGVVKIGASYQIIDSESPPVDFHRTFFDKDVKPGECVEIDVGFTLKKAGHYKVKFDLVSEVVTWFEQVGSVPVSVDVIIK